MQRLTIDDQGTDMAHARRAALRVADVLGEALASDPALRSRRIPAMEIQAPVGLSADRLADYIARQIRARLA